MQFHQNFKSITEKKRAFNKYLYFACFDKHSNIVNHHVDYRNPESTKKFFIFFFVLFRKFDIILLLWLKFICMKCRLFTIKKNNYNFLLMKYKCHEEKCCLFFLLCCINCKLEDNIILARNECMNFWIMYVNCKKSCKLSAELFAFVFDRK